MNDPSSTVVIDELTRTLDGLVERQAEFLECIRQIRRAHDLTDLDIAPSDLRIPVPPVAPATPVATPAPAMPAARPAPVARPTRATARDYDYFTSLEDQIARLRAEGD